ncbi:hypothetical protein [Dyadobacter sp. Leaf189]|uniref:hypothetical protein n=1 Tax=Dyadobacter sp. Leaf189 TaxID=1736295 RepID=UPI0012FA1520|nr:hypothetical protein [Dyadobacter sp. Leaf189]
MKTPPSKGERLKWEYLDKVKSTKLTPELTTGKRLSPAELETRSRNNKSFIVP